MLWDMDVMYTTRAIIVTAEWSALDIFIVLKHFAISQVKYIKPHQSRERVFTCQS